MSKLIVTFALSVLTGCCLAQPHLVYFRQEAPYKLIYRVDSGADYMIPFIEEQLRRMEDYETGDQIFSQITNLNLGDKSTNLQAYVRDTYVNDSLAGHTMSWHDSTNLSRIIANSDKVLEIKVNTFKQQLEFQFYLYDVTPVGPQKLLNYNRAASVFVDPRGEDYQKKIEQTLKTLFPRADYPPREQLWLNGVQNNHVSFNVNDADTLYITATLSDYDTQDKDLHYHWYQAPGANPLPLERTASGQVLTGLRRGHYKLYFYADDGICSSRLDSCEFAVLPPPRLRMYNASLTLPPDQVVFQRTLLERRHYLLFSSAYEFYIDRMPDMAESFPTILHIQLSDANRTPVLMDTVELFQGFSPYKDTGLYFTSLLRPLQVAAEQLMFGKYTLRTYVSKGTLSSTEDVRSFNISERRPQSFFLEYNFQPFAGANNLNSWFNISGGMKLRLTPIVTIAGFAGLNAINNFGSRYYGGADIGVDDRKFPLRYNLSLLFERNSDSEAVHMLLGMKIFSPALVNGTYTDLRGGVSFYYNPNPGPGNNKFVFSLIETLNLYTPK